MPKKLAWSTAGDNRLIALRLAGESWDGVAAALRVSRHAAIERGRKLGDRLPTRERPAQTEDGDRKPLPPGHRDTWGAITAGTSLEGAAYPTGARHSPRDMRPDR